MNKLILLNGPPRSGKDTIANLLKSKLDSFETNVINVKISGVLKEMTHRLYNITNENGKIAPHDYFEKTKDIKNELFLNITPRQAYINMSELYLKPTHGKDVLGIFLKEKINKLIKFSENSENLIFVVSDCGFSEEIIPLTRIFDPSDISLFRVIREGTYFEGDSRNYIFLNDNLLKSHMNLVHEENNTLKAVNAIINVSIIGNQ